MKHNNTAEFLGTKKLFPLLMRMSVPSVIGMMVGSLYNVVDTVFIGHGAGALAIAGLSVAFPIQLIVMAAAQMIGFGAASIISRRLGEKQYDQAGSALGTAFTSLVLISVIVSAGILLFSDPILRLFGSSDQTMSYAGDYIGLVAWGLPFLSFSMAGSNVIRAEGKAQMAMFTMLLGLVLNIALDPVFIFGFKMGIRGAALATVISQACSALWILWFYIRKKSVVIIEPRHLLINWRQAREMMVLGLPNFIQTAGMSVLTLIINNTLLVYSGDMAIAVYGIISRLLTFVIFPVVGISMGFQPIAGYNYGAQKFDRVKTILKISAGCAALIAAFFSLIMEFFPYTLIGIFTRDEALIETGGTALRIMALLITVMGVQIVFSTYFQAVGKGWHALLLGLSRQFLVLIPMVLIFPYFFGINGVWAAFPASDLVSTLFSALVLSYELKNLDDRHANRLELLASTR